MRVAALYMNIKPPLIIIAWLTLQAVASELCYIDAADNFEIFDSEFDVVSVSVFSRPPQRVFYLHHNRERREAMCLLHNIYISTLLTVFRLIKN